MSSTLHTALTTIPPSTHRGLHARVCCGLKRDNHENTNPQSIARFPSRCVNWAAALTWDQLKSATPAKFISKTKSPFPFSNLLWHQEWKMMMTGGNRLLWMFVCQFPSAHHVGRHQFHLQWRVHSQTYMLLNINLSPTKGALHAGNSTTY